MTGWTLAYQMGVKFDRELDDFNALSHAFLTAKYSLCLRLQRLLLLKQVTC